MEENFYNDDFEKYLQDQVKQHKMFPSDRVWRNINKNLHNDYRWPALTIAAFAFLAATIAVSIYFSPGPNIFALQTPVLKQQHDASKSENTPLTSVINNRKKTVTQYLVDENNRKDLLPVIIEDILESSSVEQPPQSVENTTSTNTASTTSFVVVPEQYFHLRKIDESGIAVSDFSNEGLMKFAESFASPVDKSVRPLYNFEPDQQENIYSLLSPIRSGKKSKFSYQVYITPSASYRKLEEDGKSSLQQAANIGGPIALNYVADVNQVVRHKPGTGMEAGVSFGYQLSNKLRVKTGLQLNARQYAIEAYRYSVEVATIALFSGGRVDSMTSYSSFRTNNGYTSTELTNRYYQLAIPVGLEYEVIGNKNVQLNVAASLQPTYMLSKNSYLISTDYKNYIENPGMTRTWNVNANVESFLSIKSGNFKWQVGPQFRYQTLPTSVKEYPIKEYLIDYGVKIGVVKDFK